MGFFERKRKNRKTIAGSVWARDGMLVTFRAEIMPGKTREERTFRIERVSPNGRVVLEDFIGEHREGAFEPINFLREKSAKDQKS